MTLGTLAQAQDAKPSTRRVVLKNVLPTQAASLIGANREATKKDKATLTLKGSKETVSDLEKMLRFVDTKPLPIRLEMRLMKIPIMPKHAL